MSAPQSRVLLLHGGRWPGMEVRDYVKLLYQSEFGPGHMAGEFDEVLAYLKEEFAQAAAEGYTPPYTVEAIGGGLCRFHLDPRRITEADLPLLAKCFIQSAQPRGTMTGLWEKLGLLSALAWKGDLPLDIGEVELFLAAYGAKGCPALHHSEGYRELNRPHYRVIDRDLACYGPALRAIDAALRESDGPVTVAVDGRCGAGKTTFAARCAQVFGDCSVFHMDDFFLPAEKRTAERLAVPGGNVDYERAAAELFAPLSRGEDVTFRPFDCSTMSLKAPVTAPCRQLNLVEGSYSLHPALAGYAQVHIFFTCEEKVQLSRLERREAPESLESFKTRWIPLEEAYFEGLSIQDQCDVTIDTSRLPVL